MIFEPGTRVKFYYSWKYPACTGKIIFSKNDLSTTWHTIHVDDEWYHQCCKGNSEMHLHWIDLPEFLHPIEEIK